MKSDSILKEDLDIIIMAYPLNQFYGEELTPFFLKFDLKKYAEASCVRNPVRDVVYFNIHEYINVKLNDY